MKQTQFIVLLVIISILMGSCATTNQVVSEGFFQKRKYTKGWYVEKNGYRPGIGQPYDLNYKPAILNSDPENSTIIIEPDFPENNTGKETEEQILDSEPVTTFDRSVHAVNQKTVKPDTCESACESLFVTEADKTEDLAASPSENKLLLDEPSEKPDYMQEARASYRKSWAYTLLAIVLFVACLLLFINAYTSLQIIAGFILLAASFVAYIFMYIHLNEAAINLVHHAYNTTSAGPGYKSLQFLIWAHIVTSSFFTILLFPVPIIWSAIHIGKVKKSYWKYD